MFDLTFDKIQLFLLAVMPGVVALKVYDLFHPREKRDVSSAIAEVAVFSFVNFVIWSVPLRNLNQAGFDKTSAAIYVAANFGMLVVSPAIMGLLSVWARKWKWVTQWIGHPEPTAWTEFFKRRQCCFLRLHLKSGGMVSGYFGEQSYATTYPDAPEVYLEQAWKMDETGVIKDKVPGTLGLLVKQSECELIEFVAVLAEPARAETSASDLDAVQQIAEPHTTGQKEKTDNGRPQ